MHYVNGNSTIYSVEEWIDFYTKFKTLLSIPLFKNFRNAKLFELWRRFLKKTNKMLYMEKLKKRFHHIDTNLLTGLLEVKMILKEMSSINMFAIDTKEAITINRFQELHKTKIKELERTVNSYRERIKQEITRACDESYQAYKDMKGITLDEQVSKSGKESSNYMKTKEKPGDEENFAMNFLKDDTPYAQDATRR